MKGNETHHRRDNLTTGNLTEGAGDDARQMALLRLMVVVVHITVTFSIALVAFVARGNGIDEDDILYGMSAALAGLFVWCFWSWWYLTRSLFDPYALFLLSACLFNGGSYLLEVFGVGSRHWWGGHHGTGLMLTTLFLVLLGIGACHLGALLVAVRQPALAGAGRVSTGIAPADLLCVGWFLVALSIVPSVIGLREALAVVHSGGYEGFYRQSRHQGLESANNILAAFLMPGVMFLLAGSRGKPVPFLSSALLLIAHALGIVLIGRRADAFIPILGYLWVYDACVKRLPKGLLAAAMAIGLGIVFPLVSQVRHRSLDKNLSVDSLSKAYGAIDNPLVSQIDQMGFSASTIADTLRLVPATRPHDGGLVYLNAGLSVIPNLLNPVDLQARYGGTPEVWLMNTEHPRLAATGLYLGYSFIAEAYLAFGWLGAPVALLIIGSLVARLSFWAIRSGSAARIAAVGAFLVPLMHYARGHSLEVVRPFFWYSVAPYCLTLLVSEWRAVGPKGLSLMKARLNDEQRGG